MDEKELGLEMAWEREEAVEKLLKLVSLYDGDNSKIMTNYRFSVYEYDVKKE